MKFMIVLLLLLLVMAEVPVKSVALQVVQELLFAQKRYMAILKECMATPVIIVLLRMMLLAKITK